MPTAAPNTPAAPKPSRGRALRVAKWVGLVVCVGLGAVYLGSLWYSLSWWHIPMPVTSAPARVYTISQGGFAYTRPSQPNVSFQPPVSTWYFNRAARGPNWWPRWYTLGGLTWWVPLWMPLAILASATAILWYRDRRSARRQEWQCAACGYDRRGVKEQSRCPECGAAGPGMGSAPASA